MSNCKIVIPNQLMILKDMPTLSDHPRAAELCCQREKRIKKLAKYRKRLEVFRMLLEPPPKCQKILSVGCGLGLELLEFANWGYDITGLEIVKDYCEIINKMGEHFQCCLRACLGDACNLPYTDEAFDIVISESFFEHVYDFDLALSEQIRVLRPGGILIIIDGNLLSPRTLFDLLIFYPIRTKGEYGGIRWLFKKREVVKDLYGGMFTGRDEDIKTALWWRKKMAFWKGVLQAVKITTTAEYLRPEIPGFLRPFIGMNLVIARKLGTLQ